VTAGRLALLIGAILLLGASGHVYSADGLALWQVAHNLLAGRGPVLAAALQDFGHWHEGRLYSKFGIGQSVLLLPFAVAGRLAGAEEVAVALFNTLVVTLIAFWFGRVLDGLGVAGQVRRKLTLLLVFTTPLWAYAKHDFPEPLCALLLLGALDQALRGRHLRAGLVLGAAVLVRHDLALIAAVWLAAYPVAGRVERARYLTGLLPAALLAMAFNYARYGAPLMTGFGDSDEQFSTPLGMGLGGLLFSPGKSLFIYAPVLVLFPAAWLQLRRARPTLAWSLFWTCVAYTLLHAKWYAWMGGWCWGPRRLVPLLPLLMLPLAWWHDGSIPHRARLLLAFGLCGLLVNFAGVAVNYNDYLATDY